MNVSNAFRNATTGTTIFARARGGPLRTVRLSKQPETFRPTRKSHTVCFAAVLELASLLKLLLDFALHYFRLTFPY